MINCNGGRRLSVALWRPGNEHRPVVARVCRRQLTVEHAWSLTPVSVPPTCRRIGLDLTIAVRALVIIVATRLPAKPSCVQMIIILN